MRFRNYRNSFNRRNRIYSDEDLLEMKLATIFDNENDIIAQNHDIGIPTRSELESSQNTKWVEPFVDKNGINDGGYWQSVLDEEQTPQIQESLVPQNNTQSVLQANNQEQPYLLKGEIEFNEPKPKTFMENLYFNYGFLSPKAAIQKALAKAPIWKSSAKEYYQHSLKRADGEEPTDFMKQNNDFRKLDEISDPELKQIYIEKAAKMHGLDVNDPATYDVIKNTEIVIPKIDSQLYSQVKNSETFQKWVAENYDNIKNQTNENTSLEFPKSRKNNNAQRSLFATIHNTDLKNSKINEDGSFSVLLSDGYDFDKMSGKQNGIYNKLLQTINNDAYEQQELGQLQRYLLSTQINLSKEEIEEILRKYKQTH